MRRKPNCFNQKTSINEGILWSLGFWSLGSNLAKMYYLFNFINTVYILSGFSGTICSSQSHNLNSSLFGLLTTDSTEINWIFLVIVIDWELRIYPCVKQETLRPDLTKAGCWTQENVNWETIPWEQLSHSSVREVPMSSRLSPRLKLPGSFSSDHGLCQLNTKGGVKLGDLCILSVQNQSQHHSPVSGWHLTPTEASLNSHCFKACVVFKQSLWFSLSYLPPQCKMRKLPCWRNYIKSGKKIVYSG